MIRNALAAALLIYVVLVAVVLNECVFLASIRGEIWSELWKEIVGFSMVVVLNVFAGIYAVLRRLALKDTGDKLSHLETQLRGRQTISEELTERILHRR